MTNIANMIIIMQSSRYCYQLRSLRYLINDVTINMNSLSRSILYLLSLAGWSNKILVWSSSKVLCSNPDSCVGWQANTGEPLTDHVLKWKTTLRRQHRRKTNAKIMYQLKLSWIWYFEGVGVGSKPKVFACFIFMLTVLV